MSAPAPRAGRGTLVTREQRHRRAVLLGIALLLVLGTSPVFGHHLPIDTSAMLRGLDHIGTMCVTALHLLLEPVHRGAHVVILAGVAYAIADRVRAWRAVRRALGALDARSPSAGDPFWRAAVEAELDPGRVLVVAGLPNPAFTVGLLSPRVYVAESLVEALDAGELAAVLAHERAHVVRRDPLRLSLLRALACTLFWIPALRRLADDLADEAEVLADDAAERGRPLVLASAILTLAGWPRAEPSPAGAVGFHEPDLLERRIRRLAGEETPVRSRITRRSIAGAVAALALVWAAGVVVVHPLPAERPDVHARHCDHRGESALAHLFCLGSPLARATGDCPH